jgi:hypothetical protein
VQVCLITYVFGDFRQLRKFELSRPAISRPQLLPKQRPIISHPLPVHNSGPIIQPPILPISQPVRHSPLPQPSNINASPCTPPPTTCKLPSVHSRSISSIAPSVNTASGSGSNSSSSPASDSESNNDAAFTIEISPAYYDEVQIEGPATGFPTSTRYEIQPNRDSIDSNSRVPAAEFTPTASFIHPYNPLCASDFDGTSKLNPEERQGIAPFDFDLLPKREYTFPQRDQEATNDPVNVPSIAEKDRGDAIGGSSGSKNKARHSHQYNNNQDLLADTENVSRRSPSPRHPAAQLQAFKSVPIFTSPFTRVLNPVVTRAQWEIVVRSVGISLVVCWTIIGSLLAIPVVR